MPKIELSKAQLDILDAEFPIRGYVTLGCERWPMVREAARKGMEAAASGDGEINSYEMMQRMKAGLPIKPTPSPDVALVERLLGDTQMSDRPWAVALMAEAARALTALQSDKEYWRNMAEFNQSALAATLEKLTALQSQAERQAERSCCQLSALQSQNVKLNREFDGAVLSLLAQIETLQSQAAAMKKKDWDLENDMLLRKLDDAKAQAEAREKEIEDLKLWIGCLTFNTRAQRYRIVDAEATIEAQRGEIAETVKDCGERINEYQADLFSAYAKVAALKAALEPFAKYYELNDCRRGDRTNYDTIEVPIHTLHAAHAALQSQAEAREKDIGTRTLALIGANKIIDCRDGELANFAATIEAREKEIQNLKDTCERVWAIHDQPFLDLDKAKATIEAQRGEIGRLKERNPKHHSLKIADCVISGLQSELTKAQSTIAALKTALEPFAMAANHAPDRLNDDAMEVSVRDLRRARAALSRMET